MKKIDSVNLVGIMLNNGKYLSFIRTDGGVIKFLANQNPVNLLLGLMVKLAINTLILNLAPGINCRKGLIQNGHRGITAMALQGKNVSRFHYVHPKKKKIRLL